MRTKRRITTETTTRRSTSTNLSDEIHGSTFNTTALDNRLIYGLCRFYRRDSVLAHLGGRHLRGTEGSRPLFNVVPAIGSSTAQVVRPGTRGRVGSGGTSHQVAQEQMEDGQHDHRLFRP